MGRCRVGPHAIREYLGRMRERYERAGRATKGPLLDEVCDNDGVSPQGGHSAAPSPAEAPPAARRAAGTVRPGGRGRAAGDLDGRRLPVVGAVEGAAAALAAVGPAASCA